MLSSNVINCGTEVKHVLVANPFRLGVASIYVVDSPLHSLPAPFDGSTPSTDHPSSSIESPTDHPSSSIESPTDHPSRSIESPCGRVTKDHVCGRFR